MGLAYEWRHYISNFRTSNDVNTPSKQTRLTNRKRTVWRTFGLDRGWGPPALQRRTGSRRLRKSPPAPRGHLKWHFGCLQPIRTPEEGRGVCLATGIHAQRLRINQFMKNSGNSNALECLRPLLPSTSENPTKQCSTFSYMKLIKSCDKERTLFKFTLLNFAKALVHPLALLPKREQKTLIFEHSTP